MLERLSDLLAPHYCYNCGEIGAVLCHSCKYNIVTERSCLCIRCRRPLTGGPCRDCPRAFAGMYMIGPREGALKALVGASKFDAVREAADMQAELLAAALPSLDDAIVVPIPTIQRHIRQRGYDHTARMAKQLAGRISARFCPVLARRGSSVQHGAGRKERFRQAASAFTVRYPVDPEKAYLLVDDVTTTGASLLAAARVLRKAGARHVYAAVTTYQVAK